MQKNLDQQIEAKMDELLDDPTWVTVIFSTIVSMISVVFNSWFSYLLAALLVYSIAFTATRNLKDQYKLRSFTFLAASIFIVDLLFFHTYTLIQMEVNPMASLGFIYSLPSGADWILVIISTSMLFVGGICAIGYYIFKAIFAFMEISPLTMKKTKKR